MSKPNNGAANGANGKPPVAPDLNQVLNSISLSMSKHRGLLASLSKHREAASSSSAPTTTTTSSKTKAGGFSAILQQKSGTSTSTEQNDDDDDSPRKVMDHEEEIRSILNQPPNAGLGWVPPKAENNNGLGGGKAMGSKEERELRRKMGLKWQGKPGQEGGAGQGQKRKKVEESESEEEVGRAGAVRGKRRGVGGVGVGVGVEVKGRGAVPVGGSILGETSSMAVDDASINEQTQHHEVEKHHGGAAPAAAEGKATTERELHSDTSVEANVGHATQHREPSSITTSSTTTPPTDTEPGTVGQPQQQAARATATQKKKKENENRKKKKNKKKRRKAAQGSEAGDGASGVGDVKEVEDDEESS